MKNIIYLGTNHSNYGTGSYYNDLANAFLQNIMYFFMDVDIQIMKLKII